MSQLSTPIDMRRPGWVNSEAILPPLAPEAYSVVERNTFSPN